ncbi:methyltransferase family protein [Krasilnikovia cinnamomea]|uniref:Methyltransferase family protein n=1 Tax=Krasilnikovia cinnamomea TaxID=349313 RepID=A0A4V2G726_9ACTN|nr:class I SAM-dependent methyltransferase [Krasilnikovia cinnamomea]RZU50926.1 methyltransferase family protein [Krasilnikovia cinnamomea]
MTALDERMMQATIGALELFGIYLGTRLGIYDAMSARDSTTYGELAEQVGIAPRYAREWLEQQAVAGILTVDDAGAEAEARRYRLPEAHVGVLTTPVAPDHLAPLARMVVGIASVLDEVVDAYRTGNGVPYARYGADFRIGQGGINRPAFGSALVEEWLPALGPAAQRVSGGGRLADLGCGQGWSTLAVAQAYPRAEVWGIDTDAASIAEARAAARERDVTVRFECSDAADLAAHGPFDVLLLLEALHDLARPVDVLGAARAALGADGALLLADEAVAPSFTAPGDELERMMYGWSISHCLPAAMAEQPSAAIGTVIREDTVRRLAAEAGFARTEVLDVDGGFFRVYALHP